MGRFHNSATPLALDSVRHAAAIENAWKIHGMLADWTGKVDAKASFALAVESAVVATIVTLAGDKGRLSHLTGAWQNGFYWSGLVLLLAAVIAVITVVVPQLRSKKLAKERSENFIYFGHLRHWNSDELCVALERKDILPVLSRQLVHMSNVAWRKHRLLQVSLLLSVLGTALVGIAALMNSH
jgi:hypothetical protein